MSYPKEYYIGLMSGTSIDAMDGCLADFTDGECKTLATATYSFNQEEKSLLNTLCKSGENELERSKKASLMLASIQAKVVKELLNKSTLTSRDLIAIGSHGQTVRHCPQEGFSVQLNDAARLAFLSDIDVVSDFRSADLAAGGEGAPLTPAFNAGFFHQANKACMVLNLGGIANISAISSTAKLICGFDTGPADTLLDLCARMFLNKAYDRDAQCALQGQVREDLLARWLSHPYFAKLPPKSTGRELFNEEFIALELKLLQEGKLSIHDLMASLTELTVRSAFLAIKQQCLMHAELKNSRLVLCGGGAKNPLIYQKLTSRCKTLGIESVSCMDLGADPDYLEALSFAWFAYCFYHARPLILKNCTGACADLIAGSLTPAPHGAFARSLRN